MMKKTMILVFLGLALAVNGMSTNDEKERARDAKMEQVMRMLQENGAGEDIVEKVLRDMAERRERMEIEERDLEAGSWNEALGSEGGTNTFYGYLAGSAITSGIGNSFFGRSAGTNNNSGYGNTIVGHKAGFNNTSGFYNTFVGFSSGYKNTDGEANTFFGYHAGSSNTIGDANTFVGISAGHNNASGVSNTFVGTDAGYYNTGGHFNTFIGESAGSKNSSGCSNVYVGDQAGYYNSTGNDNVILGHFAGTYNAGSGNVFIGNQAGYSESGSNKLYIDNSNTATPLIYGDFSTNRVGINNSAPGYTFVVGTGGAHCNGTTWVNGSSREVKENIEALAPEEALQAIAGLEPVKFNYREEKGEKCLGFIAEEVPELVAMNDRKSLSPMDIVAALTRVVQEQQKTLNELKNEIAMLKRQSQKEK